MRSGLSGSRESFRGFLIARGPPFPCGTSPDPETCRQEEPRQVSALQPDSPPSVWGPRTAGCRCSLLPPQALELCAVGPHPGGGKSICAGCGGDSRVPLKGGGSIRSRWVCRRKKETFSFCHPPTTALATLSVFFFPPNAHTSAFFIFCPPFPPIFTNIRHHTP